MQLITGGIFTINELVYVGLSARANCAANLLHDFSNPYSYGKFTLAGRDIARVDCDGIDIECEVVREFF